MSGSVQVPTSPHRMMGPPRFPTPSQMNHHHSGPHHHGHGQMHRQRMSYQPYRLFPRPPPPGSSGSSAGGGANTDSEYDGRRLRKSLVRKTVDYNAAVIKQLQVVQVLLNTLYFVVMFSGICIKLSEILI